jgi:hypothetical protein
MKCIFHESDAEQLYRHISEQVATSERQHFWRKMQKTHDLIRRMPRMSVMLDKIIVINYELWKSSAPKKSVTLPLVIASEVKLMKQEFSLKSID